jgi:hypothetical protein
LSSGFSRYLGEQAAFHWHQVYGLPVNSICIFNAYGPRVRTTGVYGAVFGVFFRQKLAGEPFTVVGDGTQRRDFIYVTDIAQAFLAAARTPISGERFNLGAGAPKSINKLVDILGGRVVYVPKRPGEPDCTWADISKISTQLGGYRLLKVDTLDNRSISDDVLSKLQSKVKDQPVDAVVYADFRHGIFNKRTIPALVDAIPDGVYRVADSQVASRWGNITEFRNFDLITPNEREARFAVGDQDSGIRPLASLVYDQARCKFLILKLGERGVLACRDKDHDSLDSYFAIDSFVDQVVDAVGAGDALLAYSTLAMLASRNDAIATVLGTMAASCECEFDGNVPVTPDHVRAKIDTVERELSFG